MPAFSIDMSSPFPSGFLRSLGGPNVGGHSPKAEWYIRFGMDFAASVGREVRAAFDGHVTKFSPHTPSTDTSKVYGAQIFIRSENDMMGGFYTHIAFVPAAIKLGASVTRGDLLGKVFVVPGGAAHLHWALVEIIGGAPGGRYVGVDLHGDFVGISNTTSVLSVTFNQDGTAPVPT
jgi:murein DD-endopeptidase MepM/ murein hydrolase activator NlpD